MSIHSASAMFNMFSAAIFVLLWLAGCAPHDPRADGIAAESASSRHHTRHV